MPLANEKAQSVFEAGVAFALHLWTALSLAVDQEWGGPDSADKRDWMAGVVVDMFESGKDIEPDDIADQLDQIMQDEFDVSLEDDSSYQVAGTCVKLHKDCAAGDFTFASTLKKQFSEKRPSAAKRMLQEGDEEDSSDEEGEAVDQEGDTAMGDEEPAAKPEPVIDEDGFELVQKPRKGRR
ncbi:hypothetical protein SAICODRAFT_22391 [Saitoella complicata NRRL Y-17804]|uniref:Pre-rRNA-processing protein TSR2 n=1 Tax=Saitoella complicata (strain BCRC 22490 / CBS 7301 / JCM 7358 / NBRC 10748 / NRRL Y-17804) TaxID=698492 RepID=A0A0E9NPB1_SAICN|nr:uncharacterized protein SAICODRAFT_22391 [Saitoella complicata NRRL Y-17804]ODQ55950.1 hypothetical protein SAICODRAFT_22391 [Saitoella complicata NRRL Y-17804]GAO51506.1 hypothetical protein G7K_5605-t1 [Saitoella complicata NRRL Y-17804]